MENSIPIPQGKPGIEWNGMEWNLEYSMVEPTSRNRGCDERVKSIVAYGTFSTSPSQRPTSVSGLTLNSYDTVKLNFPNLGVWNIFPSIFVHDVPPRASSCRIAKVDWRRQHCGNGVEAGWWTIGCPRFCICYDCVLMLTHYSVVAQPEINIGFRDINRIMSYIISLPASLLHLMAESYF